MALYGLIALLATAFPPVPCTGGPCWKPPLRSRANYVLSARPDVRIKADAYVVDGFDTSTSTVRLIHRLGRRAVCYVDAGTWERWRPDAKQFPATVLGNGNGWPGERWLDVRESALLQPIVQRRIAMCRKKGFDAIDFDNADGYANASGFAITFRDQLAWNRWLANRAHAAGMTVGLKNDLAQVPDLLPYFDFAVVEQCFQHKECKLATPFVTANKAVFAIEYRLRPAAFCDRADRLGLNGMWKKRTLGNAVTFCR